MNIKSIKTRLKVNNQHQTILAKHTKIARHVYN
ncbi:helix-turn-helix domain-containing protein [Trichodesmium erythraeum]|nr:helix-turn-helix domain-containing protein [Trichodesmium erythraeum GBRTRLIN201]